MGLIRKLQNLLPRTALITFYKAFVCPHLEYEDIIHDQVHNASFHQKLESPQCNAYLDFTGAIRISSREKLYQELGFESYNNIVSVGNYAVFTRSLKTKVCVIYSI